MVDRNDIVKEIAALQKTYAAYESIHTYYVKLMNRVITRPQDVTLYEIMCMCDPLIKQGLTSTQWLKKFREFQDSR